jgi:hypothetical protein
LLEAGLGPSWLTFPREYNGYRYPAGSLVVPDGRRVRESVTAITRDLGLRADGVKGRPPYASLATLAHARVGLYRPWSASIDEGWTRFVLDQHGIPYRNVADADVRRGNLRAEFDTIVLPDAAPQELVNGPRVGSMPPEYLGGLGKEGVSALRAFVEGGGTLVCLDSSGQLAIEVLDLPVKDLVRGLPPDAFFCPGSLVRLEVDVSQTAAFGTPAETAAFFAHGAVYDVDTAKPGANRARAIARFAHKDVLMSGWLEGEGRMAGAAAVMEVGAGKGRVLLMGIRPQHRAQSLATFRFLLNALYIPAAGGR